MKPNHPEAFRLMPYRCEKCGHTEQIWNSRDGVTPFMTACPANGCDGMEQHVFGYREPVHRTLPPEVDRVFVSMTREDAESLAKDRIGDILSRESENMTPDQKAHLKNSFSGMADRFCGDGGQPMVVSVEEYDRRNQAEEAREDFAKLYRVPGIGQVLAFLDTNPDGKPDAEIRIHFRPGVEGLGVCSTSLGFLDDEKGDAVDKAECAFARMTQETAEKIAGRAAQEIRKVWTDAAMEIEDEEGEDNG